MKKTLIIIILILIGFSGITQNKSIRTIIDTLERFDNKALVNLKTYSDSTLIEDSQAFLYLTTIKHSKFKIFPNLFKKEIVADSVVFHGLRTIYLDNGYYKHEKYNEGNLTSMTFFNQSGKEISEQEFNKNNHNIGPCGNNMGIFLIHGQKK